MHLDPFSHQLRLGFEAARDASDDAVNASSADEPALAGLTFDDLARLARDPQVPLADQDVFWAAVLRCYRRGPAPTWGAILLEMLAPELVALAKWLSTQSPTADPNDIQQQLVLEALQAAKKVPALPDSRFVKPRLSREIKRKVRRRLARNSRFSVESLEALADEDPGLLPVIDDNAVWELAELRASQLRYEDLELVFGLELRGERLEAVAREMGCSTNALECRRRRARARLQRRMAA